MTVSRSSASRVLHKALRSKAYKVVREPKLTERQMRNRIKFANWVRNNFSKTQTMRFVFSDDKIFTVVGVLNRQNERVWAVNRAEADRNGGIHRANKFPERIMVSLAVCSNGVSSVVMFDNETVNHENYIHRCLPVARQLGNRHFGNNWTFQQDGARAHTAPPQTRKNGARSIFRRSSKKIAGQRIVPI